MSTAIPAVVDALIATATANLDTTTVEVRDGYGISDDPGDYLMVGVDDPNNLDSARGAEAESDWRHVGHVTRREEGSVVCAALSWNGDGNLKLARDTAFGYIAALEAALKTDPSMGGVVMFATTNRHVYLPNQTATGAEVIVVFTVSYVANI